MSTDLSTRTVPRATLTDRTSRRPALGLAAVGVLGTLGAGVAWAGAAQATTATAPAAAASATAVQSCTIRVVSVHALDLQEDNQTDEIFVRLGDSRTTQQSYVEGQSRNTLATGSDVFVGPETVRLVESDGPGNTTVLATRTVPCNTATRTATLASANGDAIYRLTWQVTVNP